MAIFDFLFGSKNPPPVTTTEGMSIPKLYSRTFC